MRRLVVGLLASCFGGYALGQVTAGVAPRSPAPDPLRLGNFSVSLAVADIAESRSFYEKLGFHVILGEEQQHWLILQNETATIGLFQGLFPRNILTFNPGWDRAAQPLTDFDDIRQIQRTLRSRGVTLTSESADTSTGPASLMLVDPDGNPILVDQHVARPRN